MTRAEVMALLREKRWTVTALAERWGYSRRHVTAMIANEERGALWEDALRGLPVGPGFYRAGRGHVEPCGRYGLVIGSVLASESEMYTFDYGAKGVVVEVRGIDRWLVVWDGGAEMEIDGDCLEDWVMDLGMVVSSAERLRVLPLADRVAAAKLLDLNAGGG